MTKRPWVVHPFLLAPLPILRLYSSNQNTIPIRQVITPSLGALAAVGLLFGGLRLARVDGLRAGLMTSSVLVGFFGFRRAVELLASLGFPSNSLALEASTLLVEVLAIAALALCLIRVGSGFSRLTNLGANAGSFALAVFWLVGFLAPGGNPSLRAPVPARPVPVSLSTHPARKPSVYYLVLDAYGRSDILRDVYGFDNSAFVDKLKARGFFVAERSTSNYGQTALSFAATLNFRYLDDLAGSSSPSRLPLRDLIQRSAVFDAFRSQGYRLISFATGFDATELSQADTYLQPRFNVSGFDALLIDQTPIWLLSGRRTDSELHRMHRERIQFTLEHWPTAPVVGEGPTFCFGHILAPHPPFDFGAEGQDTSDREGPFALGDGEVWRGASHHGGPAEYEARYRDQATYLTSRVDQAVETILARHPPTDPPIIIIQGDHGPGSHYESNAQHPLDVRERMSILYAVYFPDKDYKALDDSITPVNTFRVVLDHYFGSKLGRLPDRNFSAPYRTPYRFVEVTDQLINRD